MKKLLFGALLLSSIISYGQAYPQFQTDQELRFNIGLFLATTTVDISYEHFLNDDTSIGGTVYFDNTPTDYNGNFGIGPNFRAYFGYGPRDGFFAEAFGLYYRGEIEVQQTDNLLRNNEFSTVALGIGVGNKWVTRSERFSLEISGGLGRNINPEIFQDTFTGRVAFSIGFRF